MGLPRSPPGSPFFFRPPSATGAALTATTETVPVNIGFVTGPTPYPSFAQSAAYIGGLNYNLPGGWELNASIDWGIGDNNGHKPAYDTAAFNAAMLAGQLDPFSGKTDPTIAANIRNNDSVLISHQEIHDYEFKGDGPLWTLPAGDIKLAVGGDYRQFVYDASQLNTSYTPAASNVLNNLLVKATRSTWAAFAELSIPLVGPANALPLIQSLSISAAVRHDELSNNGNSTTLNSQGAPFGVASVVNSAVTTNPKIGSTGLRWTISRYAAVTARPTVRRIWAIPSRSVPRREYSALVIFLPQILQSSFWCREIRTRYRDIRGINLRLSF